MTPEKYPQLLPYNSTKLERTLDQTAQFCSDLNDDYSIIHDPMRAPKQFLPFLAWIRSVDEYDDSWSEEKKRSVIAQSPEIHLRKGTIGSMRRAVRAAGYGEIIIIEGIGNEKHNGKYRRDGSIRYSNYVANTRRHDGQYKHNRRIRYTHNVGNWARYCVIMKYQLDQHQAQTVRNILNATAPARNELVELRYLENRKHDASFQRNGTFTYGVN